MMPEEIEIDIISQVLRERVADDKPYWNLTVYYRKIGHHHITRKITVNAFRWNNVSKEIQESALQRMIDGKLDNGDLGKITRSLKASKTKNIWIVSRDPDLWCRPYRADETGIKNYLYVLAGEVLLDIKDGHRNWYSHKVIKDV